MKTQSNAGAELRLSLEELSLILSLLGHAEVAKVMLGEYLGEPSADELRGRMLAASNSLLARGIIHPAGDQVQMEPVSSQLFRPIVQNDYVIQCNLLQAGQEERVLSYFRRNDQLVEMRPYYGIYTTIRAINDNRTAVESCETFFELVDLDLFPADPFTLNGEQAQAAELLVNGDVNYSQSSLESMGVESETAAFFAEDFARPAKRAVALRLRAGPEEQVLSDAGYLAVTGTSGRTWLLTVNSQDKGASVLVQPATRDLVRESTMTLLEPL